MIRISTCVIAALVFLGILFALNCAVLVFFGWRIFGSIPLVLTGYLLGLLRMRSIANQMAGTAAAGVAKILAALGVGEGCGSTCIQATSIVNNAEPAFLANVQQYEAGQITQSQAIDTYNNLWSALAVACHAIPGTAGQTCLSDRQQGACTWKQTSDGDTLGLPGVPAVGECWNWYLGYYVPLTYPPVNAPAASAGSSAGSSSTGTSSSSGGGRQEGHASGAGHGGTQVFPLDGTATDPTSMSESDSEFSSKSVSESDAWSEGTSR